MRADTTVDRRTRRRADNAKEKIRKMIAEITGWNGERPTVVRVNMGDYLALTECGYVRDGVLSGDPHSLEVKPG
jgi:hypothetical protein